MRVRSARRVVAIVLGVGALAGLHAGAGAAQSISESRPPSNEPPTLADAQQLFYNASYDEAAALALALALSEPEPDDLAAFELRTSALLFKLKRLLPESPDKEKAFKRCERCPELMTAFLRDTAAGQARARARVKTNPADYTARFFLGKIDLNYVWLQLGPLGKRTGWDEYWEARKSLDAVLKHEPGHVRARVARAWIDYIVDTRMPRGTRWILGGGSRERAVTAVRQAVATDTDFFTHTEAAFALWEMQVREKNLPAAVVMARELARDFPGNPQISDFLQIHDPSLRATKPGSGGARR